MHTLRLLAVQRSAKLRSGAWLFALLLLAASLIGTSGTAAAAPAAAPNAPAALPVATCSLAGSVRTCDLYATTGSLTMPDGVVVPVWGYSDAPATPAQVPGPALIVNEGETINIVLHNTLTFTTSLSLPDSDLAPDMDGVAPGGTKTYTFSANRVGTSIYEAGLTAGGARQVAMGMFGAFITRPAANAGWAYGYAESAFQQEYLLVFSEIDPAFNAAPDTFVMSKFAPRYWLLNGQAFSPANLNLLAANPGDNVLLRYVNAGMQERSLGLLGLRQNELGADGSGNGSNKVITTVAETLGAGTTLDAITTIPATVTTGMRYPLYNTGLAQGHNAGGHAADGTVAAGGILAFLEVTAGQPAPVQGPLATASGSPAVVSPSMSVALTAHLDNTAGGANITDAEYFINQLGAPGTGTHFSMPPAGTVIDVAATIDPAVLATLPSGDLLFYVRGFAGGVWGPVDSADVDLVEAGPVIRGLAISKNPSNGTQDVKLTGTADDATNGNINVVAAEFFIDTASPVNGSGTAMITNGPAPLVSLEATLTAAQIDALAEGVHTIQVHGQDEVGNWGGFKTIDLLVDKTGPAVTVELVRPNPNNGTLSVNSSTNSLRVEASITDGMNPPTNGAASLIAWGELFIDTPGANGAGIPLVPSDANLNSSSERFFTDIPLPTIANLAIGEHIIHLHGKDAAGNWGAFVTTSLIIDKTAPSITAGSVSFSPNPTNRARFIRLLATAVDPVNGTAPASTIVAGEWFEGTDPGVGHANPMTANDGAFNQSTEVLRAQIDVRGWRNGLHTIQVRARDAAGNWSATQSGVLSVTRNGGNLVMADNFEAGVLAGWAAKGAVSVTTGAALEGAQGLQADLNGSPAFVAFAVPVGGLNTITAGTVSFLFNPNQASLSSSTDIFMAKAVDGTPLFGVELDPGAGNNPELRAWVRDNDKGVQYLPSVHIPFHAAMQIDLIWKQGADVPFILSINNQVAAKLDQVNTAGQELAEAALGPSVKVDATGTGSLYFDAFALTRQDIPVGIYLPLISKR